jgi:hypothetical protein
VAQLGELRELTHSQEVVATGTKGLGYEGRLHYTNRCTAHRQRDGKPCGAWAVRGTNVCRIHGGAAKQVKRKAKERLEAGSEYVAKALSKALTDKGVKADGLGLPAPYGERLAAALEVVEGRMELVDHRLVPAEPADPPAEPTPAPTPVPPVMPPDLAAAAPVAPNRPLIRTTTPAALRAP